MTAFDCYPDANEIKAIIADDRARILLYQSLTRVIEGAPTQNKLAVYGLMAQTAANEAAAMRQRYVDDLWLVASEVGLVRLLGTVSVQEGAHARADAQTASCSSRARIQREGWGKARPPPLRRRSGVPSTASLTHLPLHRPRAGSMGGS